MDHTADYEAFQDAARGRVDLARIERHWEDILRIIGSIHAGAVRAYDVIRMLRAARPRWGTRARTRGGSSRPCTALVQVHAFAGRPARRTRTNTKRPRRLFP
ncbi:transposase (plasmid) [Streptomyces yangpuensis]|uniref:Transposase n=1 Tax=Streptomyces yangpuensis TaxID=1648182 RepID=A0ABY5Q9I5_9ACTN|nr:transposase [Streptomyces yangpuensis]UUY52523.1 transposase [Streptomyces yangpuensis]